MELKFDYTEGNHFKWGYGDEWFNSPDNNKKFKIHLGYVSRPVESFRLECIRAAKLIASKATKPIIVGLSGGSDSQMVCLSFREANVPYKAVIVCMHLDGSLINEHDIKTAYVFCEKYNVEYLEHHLNLDEYYKGQGKEYAEKYSFTGLETIVQCSTMDFVGNDYCYIMGGGDVIFSVYNNAFTPDLIHPKLQGFENLTKPVWWQSGPPVMQHMLAMGYEGTSKFFLYTPELVAAYLSDPVVKDFQQAQDAIYQIYINWHRDHKMWWKCFHLLYKPLMAIREWPEMIVVRKFTGFEHLQKKINGETLEVTYQKLLADAAGDDVKWQVVCPLIEDLAEYILTPHTHSLESTRIANTQ